MWIVCVNDTILKTGKMPVRSMGYFKVSDNFLVGANERKMQKN